MPLAQTFASYDVEDLVTVDFIAFMVHHYDPIAIAIVGNTQVGFFLQQARLQSTNIRRSDFFIDVESIRLTAHGDHLSAQLAENTRGDMVSRAVSAIDHHLQGVEAQLVRKGAFAKLDIAASGVDDTAGFAQLGGINAGQLFFHFGFNGFFNFIRELSPFDREEFNAVIIERIMRSGDHNSGLRAEGSRQIGNCRRWHWAGKRSR